MLTRREFVAAGLAASPLLARKRPPNVLFIAIDDLNDWTGCLGGHPQARTPNLDALARQGVLFTNAHCAAPLCNPSRAALLTGIRPSTSGVYYNDQPPRQAPLLAQAVTLPQHFQQHGYRVVGGGKLFHYPDPESWHDYFPSKTTNKPPDPAPPKVPVNGIPDAAHFDWGPVEVPDAAMGDMQVAEWAAAQLAPPAADPFFLGVGLFRPHLPWYVPPKYFDLHPLESIVLPTVNEHDLDDVPPVGRRFARPEGDHRRVLEHNQWRQAVRGYLASISFADAVLGKVMDAFRRSPHARNTIVVLWSDHGWHLGEKLHWRKFALWEEATHNVLTISAPGVTKPGGRCGRTVSLLDVYPTLIDLCGLKPREGLEGVSLQPLLKRPAAPWGRPALTTYGRNNHSVRSERWRYIRYHDGGEELYDRQADPLEWVNLASRPEFRRIKEEHAAYLPKENAPESPRQRARPA
jgi:choline-sulfatase